MLIFVLYITSLVLLSIFSYTQIDVRSPFYMDSVFEKYELGFQIQTPDQRMLIGMVFSVIFLFLIILHVYFIRNHKKLLKSIDLKKFLLLILIITLFAYPAVFSADIYNYIFYSKILVVYKELPWLTSPVNFPNDPLLQTLHWPDAYSRYGPVWIIFSSISYVFSFGNLLLAMWNLKLLFFAAYLATLFVLYKIAAFVSKVPNLTLIAFITNPLIIFEYLVNPHVDVLMNLFALLLLYFLIRGEYLKGFVALVLSLLTKIVTLPLMLGIVIKRFEYFKNSPEIIVKFVLFLSFIGSAIISYKWSLNPWYLSLPIVIMTLLIDIKFYRYLMISLSSAAIVRYLPLIFLGYFPPNNKIRRDLFLMFMIPCVLWIMYRLFITIKADGFKPATIKTYLKEERVI